MRIVLNQYYVKFIWVLFYSILSSYCYATPNVLVVSVVDGDTVWVKTISDQKKQKVRLAHIDAPEKSQAYGKTAKKKLKQLIHKKYVRISVLDTDRYGRSIADIFIDDRHVNKWMVRDGWAWVYRKYTNDERYYQAEKLARQEKRGLWHANNPVAPWVYRKKQRSRRNK